MRRKTLINRVKAVSLERKVLSVSSILTLTACFMPWYGINSRVINEWWNAFGSIGSVAGYIVLSFSLASLALLALPVMTQSEISIGKHLPFRESTLLVFLQGQSFFVSLLFIPVYSQYSLINATNSGTRFGLYVALLSTLVGTLFAISHYRKGGDLLTRNIQFTKVPQTQRSLNQWDDESGEDLVSEENERQEEVFVQETEAVATVENSSFSPYKDNNHDQEPTTDTFDPYQ
jgi:hypothetical protein